jgi:hypothetical protein
MISLEDVGNLGQYQGDNKYDGWDANGNQWPSTVKRRREFENYAFAKGREIDEQRLAWRYYHVDQWTIEQLRILRKRQQPAITFDRTGRKIDSLTGTIRRLRTDPKAYPNTPNGEQGAEVATQVVRTICDASAVEDLEVECCKDALIHGIGVSELVLRKGDKQDPDLGFNYVDPRTYFYDPRSTRTNFHDTRFHGVYKWADSDELEAMFPGSLDEIRQSTNNDGGYWTAFDADREPMWIDIYHRVRLVDHWYKEGQIWKWSLHTGIVELMSGESPFINERGQSISKFQAFSAYVDIHGDHYGLVRRLRGPQDAINQHRSKAMHIMNTRQIKLKEGAVDDVEATRREVARPDGTIVYRGDSKDLEIIQPEQEFIQQTNYYNDAKAEIDGFGPNQQLISQFGQNVSGRAANMLQQAGLAELGPFLKNFRIWKLERYRAAWIAAQKYWTADRMLRVSTNQGVAQFMQINGLQLNEYGLPMLVNFLGNIDVEIKMDEGQDAETVMNDIFDVLIALSQNQVPVPPAAIIEVSNLPASEKQKLQQLMNQPPDPMKQQAMQIALADKQADVQKKTAEIGKINTQAQLNAAKAQKEGMPDQAQPGKDQLDIAEQLANINETNATAMHKRATAHNITHGALMSPLQLLADHAQKNADRVAGMQNQMADRAMDHFHRTADRMTDTAHRNADRMQAQQAAQQAQQPQIPE